MPRVGEPMYLTNTARPDPSAPRPLLPAVNLKYINYDVVNLNLVFPKISCEIHELMNMETS